MPVPVARHAGGQHQQRWYAQGTGEMGRRIADRHHNIAGTDQRSKTVEILTIVDGINMQYLNAGGRLNRLTFSRSVAVLQIDKLNALQFE